jgi:hypothetical protein
MEFLLPPGIQLENDFRRDEPAPLAPIGPVYLRDADRNSGSEVYNGRRQSNELGHGIDSTSRIFHELLVAE